MAQKYVDRCNVGHGGTDGSDNLTPHSWVGQNYAAGPGEDWSSGVVITDKWHDEEEFYSYGNGGWCSSVCGHYTQVCTEFMECTIM